VPRSTYYRLRERDWEEDPGDEIDEAVRETFRDLENIGRKLNDYVWWYDKDRLHSTLNHMSPVEFRLAGMSLSK
jgi:transposase InsO family protein